MEMKKTDIKGKDYIMVNERIKAFRAEYKGYSLESGFVELNDKFCVIQAVIKDDAGKIVSTGFAREVNGDSFINKTSYVENCETSAWGRALGNLGIGIDTSVASYEEVANAVIQQKMPEQNLPVEDINGNPIDKEAAKNSYNACVGALGIIPTADEVTKFVNETREGVAITDKWSVYQITAFRDKAAQRYKDLS